MNDTLDIATLATPVSSRDEVLARLRQHEVAIRRFGATAMYLFGSAARDEMTDASDVDLFVDYIRDGSLDYFSLCRIEVLARGALGRNVDLTMRDGLRPRLRERIERSSIRLF